MINPILLVGVSVRLPVVLVGLVQVGVALAGCWWGWLSPWVLFLPSSGEEAGDGWTAASAGTSGIPQTCLER